MYTTEQSAPTNIPDLKTAISTLQDLISDDNSTAGRGNGNEVTKRILDLVEDQEGEEEQELENVSMLLSPNSHVCTGWAIML